MKTSLFIIGFSITGLVGPAFANDPIPEKGETAKKTEKAEPVKRAEFFREQYALFTKTDKNFDGQITHDEILQLTHDVNKPKYVAAFKALDLNNNGFLSSDEFETKHLEFTAQRVAKASGVKERLLRQYDQDGNGVITSSELDEYIEGKAKALQAQTATNAAKDLKGKDDDDSGAVSLDEYLDSKTIAPIRLSTRPAGEQLVLTRDPNGDKIITRSENEIYMSQLFEVLDKNKDGKLSAAEQSSKAFEQGGRLTSRRVYLSNKASLVVR